MKRNRKQSFRAFTLAELLIALAILGVIATFTIPKVLQAQQDSRFRAIAKEAAGMITGAYDAYRLQHGAPPTTLTPDDLSPYMNFVRYDTSASITFDNIQGYTTYSCNVGRGCIRLANGALVWFVSGHFGGTDELATLRFYVDPDGKVTDGTTNGPGKSVCFFLHYNGKLDTWATAKAGSYNDNGLFVPPAPAAGVDPPWFGWD